MSHVYIPMPESMPWEPWEGEEQPPQVCELCAYPVEDGSGSLTDGEHLICEDCERLP